MIGDAAWHDAVEMAKVGGDIQADAVETHPPAQLHADGGDLVFSRARRGRRPVHPYAHSVASTLAGHSQTVQGGDDPCLETGDKRPGVAASNAQVEHDVGHPLARPVVGELPAASAAKDVKSVRRQQIGRLGRDSGGIQRRMFEEPDELFGLAQSDGLSVPFHGLHGGQVRRQPRRHRPADRPTVRPQESSRARLARRWHDLANVGRPSRGAKRDFPSRRPFATPPGSPRGRGGIGRRAALRSLWGNPWKFESSRPHQCTAATLAALAWA